MCLGLGSREYGVHGPQSAVSRMFDVPSMLSYSIPSQGYRRMSHSPMGACPGACAAAGAGGGHIRNSF